MTSNPYVTVSELCRYVHHEVKPTTMRRYVRKLGFTRKRCRLRHVKADSLDHTDLRSGLRDIMLSGREVISVDETSVYLTKPAGYGYSRRGERLVVRHDRPIRSDRVSMVLAVSNVRGIVGHCLKQGSFNTNSFTQFMCDLDAPLGSVLLMDNVRFHHAADTKVRDEYEGFRSVLHPTLFSRS